MPVGKVVGSGIFVSGMNKDEIRLNRRVGNLKKKAQTQIIQIQSKKNKGNMSLQLEMENELTKLKFKEVE